MATVEWSATSNWSGGAVVTNNVKDEGVWYVATESAPASAYSYSFRDIRNEWIVQKWFDMAEDKFNSELVSFEEQHVEEKDHMVELEELFEI